MDWLNEIEARANLVAKNHEDWSVADAVMLAGHDVPKLVAEVARLRNAEESLVADNTRLRAELEAANARWEETASDGTDYTLTHSDGIYTVSDPQGHVVCEFMRGVTENGGVKQREV